MIEPLAASRLPEADLLERLGTTAAGLSDADAAAALRRHGPNQVAREQSPSMLRELMGRARNPLNALLVGLALLSWSTGDLRAAVVILVMVVLSVGLSFVQEHRSNRAAAALRAMVRTTTAVRRGGVVREIPVEQVIPGDIVQLAAGDLVPADLRLLAARDLHVNQSSLTGESLPCEKGLAAAQGDAPFDAPNLCFMGSNVLSGTASGVVLATGAETFFGKLSEDVVAGGGETSFDRGLKRFTWLMIGFMLVMVPAVFLINGLTKGDWLEALLFAVAVAVGLTPEMLPMIVTMNLAKGAIAMSRKQVIVKRLNAIQNFGAMDVLCTDKTGTLTQDRVILQYHLDFAGEESLNVLQFAYFNSAHQSGLRNLLDEAVLQHAARPEHAAVLRPGIKIDEIPFDFQRRRMSVVVDPGDGSHLLVCKGAVEEIFATCTRWERNGESGTLDPSHLATAQAEMEALNANGFRVVAVAYRTIDATQAAYGVADERDLTLIGYVAFLDPPKEGVNDALAQLAASGVAVKVVTGDNPVITRTVCRHVGFEITGLVLGHEIAAMDDAELARAVVGANVFAKVAPDQKARIIRALQEAGHVVGYMGDGINDGPALRAADVGVCVDTAVDVARESSDIILLEKNLAVLAEGVLEGRRIFGNIVKYIKMGASSNFGNMLSVLGASIFLPFLPMLPIQVLVNNLLYDFSQTTIPTDEVDSEYLTTPRRWDIGHLARFVLCIGPISSIFDYATFFLMLHVFDAWARPGLFQAGWFVESIVTQTLIIHIIRTARIPFVQSRASTPLLVTTVLICAAGAALPHTGLGTLLGFEPLPWQYWPCLAGLIAAYAVLTHLVKTWYVRRWGM
jgi:P-type Mg2+ transporter